MYFVSFTGKVSDTSTLNNTCIALIKKETDPGVLSVGICRIVEKDVCCLTSRLFNEELEPVVESFVTNLSIRLGILFT